MKLTFPITDMTDMKKSKLEIALDKCNYTMELIRTIVPIIVLIIQVIILVKLF